MDKSLGINLHFWRFCSFCTHSRREYNLTCPASFPHLTYDSHTVENWNLKFLLIFNIVLDVEGRGQ